jgi:hypothetical protein
MPQSVESTVRDLRIVVGGLALAAASGAAAYFTLRLGRGAFVP